METAKDIITAGRITKVEKVTSLSSNYYPADSFSMFLVPKAATGVELGDVMVVEALLPRTDNEYVNVPVVVGDWSPVVFRAIKASGIDLTKVDLYVAPIKELTL